MDAGLKAAPEVPAKVIIRTSRLKYAGWTACGLGVGWTAAYGFRTEGVQSAIGWVLLPVAALALWMGVHLLLRPWRLIIEDDQVTLALSDARSTVVRYDEVETFFAWRHGRWPTRNWDVAFTYKDRGRGLLGAGLLPGDFTEPPKRIVAMLNERLQRRRALTGATAP